MGRSRERVRGCSWGAQALVAGVAVGALAAAGCGSNEAGSGAAGAASGTAAASGAPVATGTATAAASGTAAAAPGGGDLDKREMGVFDVEDAMSELPAAKTPPADAPSYQKVFRQMAGGAGGYCGAHTSGNVICWGKAPADGMSGAYVQVAVADKFACALDNKGAIACKPEKAAPTLTAGGAAAGAATPAGSAGAGAGTAAAGATGTGAGSAAPGASGAPSAEPSGAEVAAPAEVKYRSIAAGPSHLCAIDKDGHGSCWGGEGACSLPAAPQDVNFRSVAVGSCHVCGKDAAGAVKCWGPAESAALKVPDGLVAKEIASGEGFSCAVDGKDALACWGTAPAAPEDAPKEIASVAARGGSVCVLAKSGALRCWGTLQVTQPGPFTAMTMAAESVCANVSKDSVQCFGSAAGDQLVVPIDTSMQTVLDPGRTPDEVAASKKKRADAFKELLAKLPERDLPFKVDRTAKVPVGRVVDDAYLPVLNLLSFNVFVPNNGYHYGFALKTEGRKGRVLVMHSGPSPKLMSFTDEGKRMGQLVLASRELNRPDTVQFDCGDVAEEVVTESEIGADLKITVRKTTTLESLGRLKNREKKIQNFCKIRQTTDVYAVSPSGSIDKVSTKSETLLDKIADEACRGKWLESPRSESYTASPDMPDECVRRKLPGQ